MHNLTIQQHFSPKEHYIHIKHLYSLSTSLYKCPKPLSSLSHKSLVLLFRNHRSVSCR